MCPVLGPLLAASISLGALVGQNLRGSLCRIHCCCDGMEGCLQLSLGQNFFPVALLAAWCWWRSWKWPGGWRQCIGDHCGVMEGERWL